MSFAGTIVDVVGRQLTVAIENGRIVLIARERDGSTSRLPFTPSEAEAFAARLEAAAKAARG